MDQIVLLGGYIRAFSAGLLLAGGFCCSGTLSALLKFGLRKVNVAHRLRNNHAAARNVVIV
jgi:hypothetical protein